LLRRFNLENEEQTMKYSRNILLFFTLFFISALGFTMFFSDKAWAVAKSHEYGDVEMSQAGQNKSVMPVIFRHWTHRDKYTCRLCHVDLEFAQVAGGTGILEEDNRDGRYCGTCHNGKLAFAVTSCARCHPKNQSEKKDLDRKAKEDFFKLKKILPPARYGNKIDWIMAENSEKIKLIDSLPGITMPQQNMVINRRDEPRTPSLPGLPGIVFSHSKHVVWSGCGMCHPEPYALEAGKTAMTMKEIISGKYCGRCHGTVAFPINDCSLCHSKPVTLK
jgi:c(7)-type cytochrome triheme protein